MPKYFDENGKPLTDDEYRQRVGGTGAQTMDEQLANPNLVDLRGKTGASGSGPGGTVAWSNVEPVAQSPSGPKYNGNTPTGGWGPVPGDPPSGPGFATGGGPMKTSGYFGTAGLRMAPDQENGARDFDDDPTNRRGGGYRDTGEGPVVPGYQPGTGGSGTGSGYQTSGTGGSTPPTQKPGVQPPIIAPPTDPSGGGQVPTTKPEVKPEEKPVWEVYDKPPIVDKVGPGEFYDPDRVTPPPVRPPVRPPVEPPTRPPNSPAPPTGSNNQSRVDELWDYGRRAMDNPSRYDSEMVRQGAQVIEDAIARMRKTGMRNIGEQMAERGLTGSSLEGFAASDLEGELGRYGNERLFNLAQDQARTWAQDSNAAFGMGLGATGMGEQIDSRLAGNYFTQQGLDLQGRSVDQQGRSLDLQEKGQGLDEAYRRWAAEQGFNQGQQGLDQSKLALLASLMERFPGMDLSGFGFSDEEIAAVGGTGGMGGGGAGAGYGRGHVDPKTGRWVADN